MDNKTKRVSVGKQLISYRTAVRGHWVFKASVFCDSQIVVIAHNELTSEFFTRVFTDYKDCVQFLEIMSAYQHGADEVFPKFQNIPKRPL
jgi:hypothetical protein